VQYFRHLWFSESEVKGNENVVCAFAGLIKTNGVTDVNILDVSEVIFVTCRRNSHVALIAA